MIRFVLLGLMVAVACWCVFLYRLGGWKWVGCYVLTAALGCAVA